MTMQKILAKLHSIMEQVEYIQKDKTNAHQKYSYASEKVIKEKLHKEFVDKKVLFQLEVDDVRVEGGMTLGKFRYAFFDIESGESLKGSFVGSGQSRDEKGVYSAITGAIKYILTSTFLIPTGDDPENDENERATKPQARASPAAKPGPPIGDVYPSPGAIGHIPIMGVDVPIPKITPEDWRVVAVPVGKNRGIPLGELSSSTIDWYHKNWKPKPNSPSDAVFATALQGWYAEKNNQ